VAAGDVLVSIDGAPPPRVIAIPFLLHPDHSFALALTRAGASVSANLAMTAAVQPAPAARTLRHCAVIAVRALTRDTAQAIRTAGALPVPDAVVLGDHVLMVPGARVVDPIDGTAARGDRVTPDVIVAGASAADVAAGNDPQLDRAIDWLTKK